MEPNTLTRTLRLDAAINATTGITLMAAGGWLAGPLGLAPSWPVRAVGLVLVVYAIENLFVSRRMSAAGLLTLIAVDLLFAVAVLGLAIDDPTGAATWVRGGLVVVAGASAAFGIAKITGLGPLSHAAGARTPSN